MNGGLLGDFAEYFKVRETPILQYYEDGVGKWAFRVNVHDTDFVCAARSKYENAKGTRASCMNRVAGRAQVSDAFVCLRIRDDIYVFDPVSILAEGDVEDPHESDRASRGEKWVYFPVSIGVSFEDWVGGSEPATFADVDQF